MSRLNDALIPTGQGYNVYSTAPMVSVVGAGQMGIAPQLQAYVQNSAHVPRNVICVVMETPRAFNNLPDGPSYIAAFKSLFEVGAKTIDGLRSTLTVEYVENAIGAAGEMQHDIAKVTRERSVPVFTFIEKDGKPITRLFTSYIVNVIGDPETNVPAASSYDSDGPLDLLPDMTAFTMMFLEPDRLNRNVVEAWLITNMMPRTSGPIEGRRDITAPGQSIEISIEMTGIQQVGAGVIAIAQSFLDGMKLTNVNPMRRSAWLQAISADVAAADVGIAANIQQVASENVA